MKVKAVEIARALDISKATVSLALNGRPGVSEETRRRILAYKEQLEQLPELKKMVPEGIPDEDEKTVAEHPQDLLPSDDRKVIRLIVMCRGLGLVRDAEVEIMTDVKALFDQLAREMGYSLEIAYFQIGHDPAQLMAEDCNKEETAGVIILGTEMQQEDVILLENIHKPLVIYDSDSFDDRYPCVAVSEYEALRKAVKYLKDHGKKNICYISRNMKVYNYEQRREAFGFFADQLEKEGNYTASIVDMQGKIDDIYRQSKTYLENCTSYPDAFLLESFHVSIGFLRAVNELKLRIPQDFSVLGIDRLPEYMTMGWKMTAVRIPYTERVKLSMMLLKHEIEDPFAEKSKIFTNPGFSEGKTVSSYDKLS